jgi:ubiquinone/menaquinone biosynthesis C-methylase UbiE
MNSQEVLQQTSRYWNLRAEGYSRNIQKELTETSKENWSEFFQTIAPPTQYPKVLDAGCGPGFFSILLALAGYQVTAIDYTENMLTQAQKNAKTYGVTIDFQQMDAQKLIFPDKSFDLVVSRNITWNLPNPHQAYSEWIRVLRSGGKLVNADGNFYHYISDPDYQFFYQQQMKKHEHLENIDVRVIDQIGEQAPLAREQRPGWDVQKALELGVNSVHTFITEESFTNTVPARRLIERFTIVMEK